MLVVMPLGMLMGGIIFDLLAKGEKKADRAKVAQTLYGAGVISGLIAALPGVWDWSFIPGGTRAKTIGAIHGSGNVLVLALFGLSWLLRRDDVTNPSKTAKALALSGFAVSGVTAWLGGEMSYRLGVGVDKGANLDSPSSLSGKKAGRFHGSHRVWGGDLDS